MAKVSEFAKKHFWAFAELESILNNEQQDGKKLKTKNKKKAFSALQVF